MIDSYDVQLYQVSDTYQILDRPALVVPFLRLSCFSMKKDSRFQIQVSRIGKLQN